MRGAGKHAPTPKLLSLQSNIGNSMLAYFLDKNIPGVIFITLKHFHDVTIYYIILVATLCVLRVTV